MSFLAWPAAARAEEPVRWCEGWAVPVVAAQVAAPGAPQGIDGFQPVPEAFELLSLAKEGARVMPGEELARFRFRGSRVSTQLQRRVQEAEAERDCALAEHEGRLRETGLRCKQAGLEVQRTRLELRKKGVLSRRDAQLLELSSQLAEIEEQACQQETAALTALREAERGVRGEKVRVAREGLARLEAYRQGYRLTAPLAGTVLLPAIGDRGRKARVGDWLSPETPFLVLAAELALRVEAAVDEAELPRVRPGSRATVRTLSGEQGAIGKVAAIDWLPRPRESLSIPGQGVGGGVALFLATIEFSGPAALKPWQPVMVAFEGGASPGAGSAVLEGRLSAPDRRTLIAPWNPGAPALEVRWVAPAGTLVKAMDVVVRLDRAPLEDMLRRAQDGLSLADAELRRLEEQQRAEAARLATDLKRKQLQLERARLLEEQGVGLTSELQRQAAVLERQGAEVELQAARERLASAEKVQPLTLQLQRSRREGLAEQVQALERALPRTEVRAPVAGMVPFAGVRGGNRVRPGEALLDLLDLSRLQARLCTAGSVGVREGQDVDLRVVGLPELSVRGRVARVYGSAAGEGKENGGGRECLRVEIAAPEERLRPGMSVLLALPKKPGGEP